MKFINILVLGIMTFAGSIIILKDMIARKSCLKTE